MSPRVPGPTGADTLTLTVPTLGATQCRARSFAPGPYCATNDRFAVLQDRLQAQGRFAAAFRVLGAQLLERWLPTTGRSQSLAHNPSLSSSLAASYGDLVIAIARSNLEVREHGSNRGDEVEEFLEHAGAHAGSAWCAAFAYWCHDRAATMFGGSTTAPATSRAAAMWLLSGDHKFTVAQVQAGTETPVAGDVFVMADPKYHGHFTRNHTSARFPGHAGLVVGYDSNQQRLTTIEGNTDPGGSREGDGVYERTDRMASRKLYGFVRPRLIFPDPDP